MAFTYTITTTIEINQLDAAGVTDIRDALSKTVTFSVLDIEQHRVLGAKKSDLVLTITLSFATSVAANFATDALKTALLDTQAVNEVSVQSCTELPAATEAKE